MASHPVILAAKKSGTKNLNVIDSMKVLEHYGIPVPEYSFARNVHEALFAADNIGYPVVLKAVSSEITHKTDVGAVALDIADSDHLQSAYERMMSNLKENSPKSKISGVMVQKSAGSQKSLQLFVGSKRDPQFGHAILFGLGGIAVEILDDLSTRIAPITAKDAEEMISEIRGYKMFKDFRGVSHETKPVVSILMKVSKMLAANPDILELDVNPILLDGKNAVAVDSRIIVG